MIRFLDAPRISAATKKIISEARREIVLVSPFLQLAPSFVAQLQAAAGRGVRVLVAYESEELAETTLPALEGLDVRRAEIIPARCYFNEEHMLLGSMSLDEPALRSSDEVGVLLTSDEPVYQRTRADVRASLELSPQREQAVAPAACSPRTEATKATKQ